MIVVDKGVIQIVGIVAITAIVISALYLNQPDFAKVVGIAGVGAIAGFLGNEAINTLQDQPLD